MPNGWPAGLPMTTANRTSGPAPFGVFFDAVNAVKGTDNTGTVQPVHWANTNLTDICAYDYVWSFGESGAPGTDNWEFTADATAIAEGLTAKSKNRAFGPVAAHVFETPGVYTVTLEVWLRNTTFHVDYTQTITVIDGDITASASGGFSDKTYYVDPVGGSDADTGTSSGHAWKSLPRAINNGGGSNNALFSSAGPRRVLLKRGTTFTNAPTFGYSASQTINGPFHLGTYGNGGDADPIIDFGAGAGFFIYAAAPSDLTLIDIDLRCPLGTEVLIGAARLMTLLRCTFAGPKKCVEITGGIHTSQQTAIGHNGVLLQECVMANYGIVPPAGQVVDSYALFASYSSAAIQRVKNVAMLGCNVTPGATGGRVAHVARCYFPRSVYSFNKFTIPATTNGLGFKLVQNSSDYCDNVIFSDNLVINGESNWAMRIEYESGQAWGGSLANPVALRNVVIENNRFRINGSASVQRFVKIESPFATFRNNVFNHTGNASGSAACIWEVWDAADHDSPEPPAPHHIRVENNTAFRSDGTTVPLMLISTTPDNFSNAPTQAVCKNNIVYGKDAVGQSVGSTDTTTDFADGTDPLFVDAPNNNFHLGDLSTAKEGTHATSPTVVRWDLDGADRRPQVQTQRSRGAFEKA